MACVFVYKKRMLKISGLLARRYFGIDIAFKY